jgi:HEAT repeat protein
MTALTSLGKIGDPSAAAAVSEALRDTDDRVRLTAIQTLNDLENKRAQEVRKIEEARRRYLQEQERQRLLQEQQKKR